MCYAVQSAKKWKNVGCGGDSIIAFGFGFLKDFIYLFSDRGEGRKRERNINMWLLLAHPQLGDLAHSLGMCPHWESNQWPFGSQAGTQSTKPHQPGL